MRSIVAALVLTAASPAMAQPGLEPLPQLPAAPPAPAPAPQDGFIAGDGSLGSDEFGDIALSLEGGLHVPSTPIWLHGMASAGLAFDAEGGGGYWRAIGGLELRGCSHAGRVCPFLDLDAGHQHATWEKQGELTEQHDGAVVAVRLGIDLGLPPSGRVRLRGALEIYQVEGYHVSPSVPTQWQGGGMLVFGVGYQL